MNRETKRPRITRPIENRDENRRGRTPRFENREGGESETRRPNRFNTDRPRREQGHGYIRDLNKERERERNEGTGDRDNGNRYYRDSDRNRERGDRENNRYENRDNRRSYERGNRDNNRFSDRGERRERRPQDRDEMQKEEIIVIKTGIVMIDERKDVGKEVPVRKEDVEKGIVAIVGIAERGMIVGIVILIVRREKCLPVGQMGMALPKVCIVRKNKLSFARRTRS